jgi:hypothetical protein
MVQRYLFFKEAQVSGTPGIANTFNSGRKPWFLPFLFLQQSLPTMEPFPV